MNLEDWMVAVLTVAAASFIVWIELHCRRNQRERAQQRGQAPAAAASQDHPSR